LQSEDIVQELILDADAHTSGDEGTFQVTDSEREDWSETGWVMHTVDRVHSFDLLHL